MPDPDGTRAPGRYRCAMTATAARPEAEGRPFASRGGIKLDNALSALPLDVGGRQCLDVGAADGGFTDCLLRRGAASVIALDVAYGALAWGLRNDPRVLVRERTNARNLRQGDLPYEPDLATLDVSFNSVARLLPAIAPLLAPRADVVALVKPQFELPRDRVPRGGVVDSAADRRDALRAAASAAGAAGLAVRGFASSGLPGAKGNRETFLWCGCPGGDVPDVEAAISAVEG